MGNWLEGLSSGRDGGSCHQEDLDANAARWKREARCADAAREFNALEGFAQREPIEVRLGNYTFVGVDYDQE